MPPRALPVMGAVKGGAEGFFFNEGEAKEYVVRPPSLGGVSNAFALYVDGESMEPRYYAGEMLYVNPNRPITRGCFVAVPVPVRPVPDQTVVRGQPCHVAHSPVH